MPIGSGLSTQGGIKKEATYGTRVAPDAFFLFTAEGFALDRNYIQSASLGGGTTFPYGALYVPTTKDVSGTLSGEVPNKGFGRFLDGLHGNVVTPVQQGTTTAYKQTHAIGLVPTAKSFTLQFGVPSTDAVVRPFDFLGCLVTGWQLACETGGFLTYQWTYDGQNADTAQTLATVTIPTGLAPFNFTQGSITIGGSPAGNVRSFTLSGTNPARTDRFFFGTTGLKAIPIPNDLAAAELTMSTEFADLTNYTRFVNGTSAQVVLTFTGAAIAGTYNYAVVITMPQVFFSGTTPQVDGPDVVDQELPCVVKYDGTNAPLTIEYTSTDVLL